MRRNKINMAVCCAFFIFSITSCASLPEANGLHAIASSDASNVVSAQSVEEVLTQNINIPVQYMLLLMAASTFVPNPFQLVGRAFSMLVGGTTTLFTIFKK